MAGLPPRLRLCLGQTPNISFRALILYWRFVNICGSDIEFETHSKNAIDLRGELALQEKRTKVAGMQDLAREGEGLQENDYWQTDDGKQRPLRLLQKPNDDMVFLGFSDAPIDRSVFELPKSCAEGRKCGGTCALVRRG